MHDGVEAFKAIVARYDAAHIEHPEATNHDDFLLKLRFTPLPDNCEAERFEKRVSDAIKNHIPFLDRPFLNTKKQSEWVISQLPASLAADGRRLEDKLTVAQFNDPEYVALECFKIVRKAHIPSIKKEGGLGEFLGALSDVPTDKPPGRRPPGLTAPGNGKKKPAAGKEKRARATECSNASTARGATCKLMHPPPCFRDNLWGGPVPRRLWDNKDAMASIHLDRTTGANARGETVVKLTPAPPIETVSVLIDEEVAKQSGSSSSSSLCTTEVESIEDEAIRTQCEDCGDDLDDDEIAELQDDCDSEIDEAIAAQSASSSGLQAFRSLLRTIPSLSRLHRSPPPWV